MSRRTDGKQVFRSWSPRYIRSARPVAAVGVGSDDKDTTYPHHHPKFDIDEDSLPLAVELLAKGTLDYLR